MTKYLVLAGISLLTCASISTADEPEALTKSEHKATEATFLITGLHCPPCTKTVEQSLSKANGISSIKVDWKSKNARLVFDESVIPCATGRRDDRRYTAHDGEKITLRRLARSQCR